MLRNVVTKSIGSVVLVLSLCAGASAVSPEMSRDETVVLLHGIGHKSFNMRGAELALQKAGYNTLNISYPSLRMGLPDLASFVAQGLEEGGVWSSGHRVHFVTHSMGGLVARQYLEDYKSDVPVAVLGRVVMMAPPLQGSEVADFLSPFAPYSWVYGPAGQQLTTAVQEKVDVTAYYDLGIIAGNKKWPYVVANFIMPDAHDGRVAVERTRWNSMKDHLVVPATHSFISWKPNVHKQIIQFLELGEFNHEK